MDVDHSALTSVVMVSSSGVLPAAFAAYYHLDKKIGLTFGVSKDFDDSVRGMKRGIVGELSSALNGVFKNTGVDVSLDSGYSEDVENPVGSDAYKEALSNFVEGSADIISDYRTLKTHCERHLCWLTLMLWTVRGLMATSALTLVGVPLFQKVFQVNISDVVLFGIFGLYAVMFGCLFFSDIRMQRHKRKAINLREKHESI